MKLNKIHGLYGALSLLTILLVSSSNLLPKDSMSAMTKQLAIKTRAPQSHRFTPSEIRSLTKDQILKLVPKEVTATTGQGKKPQMLALIVDGDRIYQKYLGDFKHLVYQSNALKQLCQANHACNHSIKFQNLAKGEQFRVILPPAPFELKNVNQEEDILKLHQNDVSSARELVHFRFISLDKDAPEINLVLRKAPTNLKLFKPVTQMPLSPTRHQSNLPI